MHKIVRAIKRDWERYLSVNTESYSRTDEVGEHGAKVLHIHALLTIREKWLPYQQMVQIAQRLSGAARPIRIEWIKSQSDAVAYCTKYASKSMVGHWWKYAHRWYTSAPALKFQPFEPLTFFHLYETDSSLWADAIDTSTGEVVRQYVGPSYVPLYRSPLPREFFADVPWGNLVVEGAGPLVRQSALPYFVPTVGTNPECGQKVADTELRSAEPLLHPNRSFYPCSEYENPREVRLGISALGQGVVK